MPPFKPMTKTALVKREEDTSDKLPVNEPPNQVVENTTERIRIIFDDSGSMHSVVIDDTGAAKPAYELAADGTIDYMKSCTPKSTAVSMDFLNEGEIPITRNLPRLAPKIKKKASSGGDTPMYTHLRSLLTTHEVNNYTRALIFTDGQFYLNDEQVLFDLQELGIPIDFILIGNFNEHSLSENHLKMKELCEKTKGQFLICKDGAIFKAKLKYFAPPLRYMLPQIASKEN